MRNAMLGALAMIVVAAGAWTWTAQAQEAAKGYEYCSVMATIGLGGKYKIHVDYGDGWTKSKDEAGAVEKFVSPVDAVNTMAMAGWELQSTYTPVASVTSFVMKRPRQ